jgi:antitoxin CptB
MKELDLLFSGYLRGRWPVAPADERVAFESLLELPDPDLAAYLLGGETAADPALEACLAWMRAGRGP